MIHETRRDVGYVGVPAGIVTQSNHRLRAVVGQNHSPLMLVPMGSELRLDQWRIRLTEARREGHATSVDNTHAQSSDRLGDTCDFHGEREDLHTQGRANLSTSDLRWSKPEFIMLDGCPDPAAPFWASPFNPHVFDRNRPCSEFVVISGRITTVFSFPLC